MCEDYITTLEIYIDELKEEIEQLKKENAVLRKALMDERRIASVNAVRHFEMNPE